MFFPRRNFKFDPEGRWHQPDRIFFGFGACHILAGAFLQEARFIGFHAEWIVPEEDFPGTHIYATNGTLAFDYHGFSVRETLLARYWAGYRERHPGWDARVEKITFPLLDRAELNARKHLGPDQYFGDPIPRAKRFIATRKAPALFPV